MTSSVSPSPRLPTTSRRRSLATAVAVAFALIVVDQLTKEWALRALDDAPCRVDGACIDVIWTLRFNLTFNPGASFSSFTGGGPVLGVIATGMTIYLLWLAANTVDRWLIVLFGLVAGGAVGNLADRVFRADDGFLSGEVVDFIDFQFWPIFNVADMAVVGGVIGLMFRLWTTERDPQPEVPSESQEP